MSQVQKLVNTKKVQEHVNTKKVQEHVDTSQVQELVDPNQVQDLVETNKGQEHVNTSQVKQLVDTSQVQLLVDPSQVQKPVDTSQAQNPVATNQVQGHVDTSQVKELVDTSQVTDHVAVSKYKNSSTRTRNQVQELVDTSQDWPWSPERPKFIGNRYNSPKLYLILKQEDKNSKYTLKENKYTVTTSSSPGEAGMWCWTYVLAPVTSFIQNAKDPKQFLDITERGVIASENSDHLVINQLDDGFFTIGKTFEDGITKYIAIDQSGIVTVPPTVTHNAKLVLTPAAGHDEQVNLVETTTTTVTEHIGSPRPTSQTLDLRKSPAKRRC